MHTLKLRRVAIDTYKENVAYMNRNCTLYRSEGFQALNKIEIHQTEDGEPIVAVLNVVDDIAITAPGELGLSEQAFRQLKKPEKTALRVAHAIPPASVRSVRQKIAGETLQETEYLHIAKDILANRYSKIELAAFLVACSNNGMERQEILHLTKAMVETGSRLDWNEPVVVDKHCIGGIPGNRTSMLIVPIVAAHGMLMPKTSSRAITSPAGTADTMETLAQVELTPQQLHNIVRTERSCLAWGGTASLAPVDDILISVERPLSMDSPGQMIASILSKKVAAGATHLLIDIPVGPTGKVRNHHTALQLRKLFEYVGDRIGLHLEVAITNGRQPIGHGIGPLLEARDVMQVLRNDQEAPEDLREKALRLAGRILEFDPDVRGGQGYKLARTILESGQAIEKMERIIEAQGRNTQPPTIGHLQHTVTAGHNGYIGAIDNLQLARIARLAGAPLDKGAGIDLHRKVNEKIRAGEPLYTVYSEFPSDFQFALDAIQKENGYTLS